MSGEEEGEAAEAAVEEGASACKADSEVEWISHFAGVVFEEEELVAACWCLRGGRDLEGGLLGDGDSIETHFCSHAAQKNDLWLQFCPTLIHPLSSACGKSFMCFVFELCL